MKACPKCKGRATKLVSISTGVITCQQCGHQYPTAADRVSEERRADDEYFRSGTRYPGQ